MKTCHRIGKNPAIERDDAPVNCLRMVGGIHCDYKRISEDEFQSSLVEQGRARTLGYADGLCRELGEAKNRNDREDESQSPDEDRTEDCSPYSKAHIEGEVRQHCAHDVASRAVEEQRQENAERSNHEDECHGRHVLLWHTRKKESWNVPECPGDRHYERRDPGAKLASKMRKKEASPSGSGANSDEVQR